MEGDDEKEKKDSQEEETVEGDNDNNNSSASLFPNLKTLGIKKCPKLKFVVPGVNGRDVPKVENIHIYDCAELKYVFGSYQHQQKEKNLHPETEDVIFTTLETMILEDLPNFVSIFPENDQYKSSSLKTSCFKEESKTELKSSVKKSSSKDGFKCNIFPWSRKKRQKLKTKFHDQLQNCTLSSSIIDGDTLNQRMSFLPRLQTLLIKKCNNVECVFPFPTSKIPPKLKVLAIIEASMLDKIFIWESDKKVEISDVQVAMFVELPSFSQGIQLSKTCLVHNCTKLSIYSTSTPKRFRQIKRAMEGVDSGYWDIIKKILEKTLDDFKVERKFNNDNETRENEFSRGNDTESNKFISAEKQTQKTQEIEQEFDEKLVSSEIQSITASQQIQNGYKSHVEAY